MTTTPTSDAIVTRLREHKARFTAAGAIECATFRNPDGPEAADLIEHLQAQSAAMAEAWLFVRARFEEMDFSQDSDGVCRDFLGHVSPAIARMGYAILNTKEG